MKFTANTADLQRALSKLGGVVPTKSTLPILENILFDLLNNTLSMTATDMEISLMISIEVRGEEDGKIAVPAKRLLETVRALDERSAPVFLADTTTNKISITTANGQYNLTGESAKEFPAVSQGKTGEEVKLPASTLKRIIHRTAFAVSTDELRPAMMGVLFQSKGSEVRAVATDGHRLVKVTQKLPRASGLKRDIIVPAKALHTISRAVDIGEITLGLTETHITFAFENVLRPKVTIERAKNNQQSLVITELPSQTDRAAFVERIKALASGKQIQQVSGVRDESEGNRMRIVVGLEGGADAQTTLDQLHEHTQTFERAVLVSRLIDETYPNYESVIPADNDKLLQVSRDVLMGSIRRVSLYASATTHQVKFDVSKTSVSISAQDIDFGGEARETIECDYKGEKLEIGFNSTYVLDMLTHLESDRVVFKFSTPTRAGIVSPEKPSEDEDITMLVMPVRLMS